MICKYYFLFLFLFFTSLIYGQILPTIPGNVFRFTFGNDLPSRLDSFLFMIPSGPSGISEMKKTLAKLSMLIA